MPTRFDNKDGLGLHIVRLNGKLSICFTGRSTSAYLFHGTDTEFSDQMLEARLNALGEPLRSGDLELYVEQAEGILDLRFEGSKGDLLTFRNVVGPNKEVNSTSEAVQEEKATEVVRHDDPQDGTKQPAVAATIEATQTTLKNESESLVLDLGSPRGSEDDANGDEEEINITNKASTNNNPLPKGVLSVFTTFNESTPPSIPLKRGPTDSPADNYRTYKHIFLEGYRTGPGDDHNEEGRLHIDLKHHELIWESCDDYEGGTRLTLDRLDLPSCVVENTPLRKAHYFGDYSLRLCRAMERRHDSASVAFSMDYSWKECKVFGNNVGTGAERRYFEGEDKAQVAVDAVQECLELRQRAAARARAYGAW